MRELGLTQECGTVLMVHNRYRYSGGEDVVFEAECDLLERNGHTVHRLTFDNRSIPDHDSLVSATRLAWSTVWSRSSAELIGEEVRKHRPDVVHFHNTLPLISPSGYYAARERGARIVQTLHNYRLICPNALLSRDNAPCEDCVGRRLALPGIRHKCYRGSRRATAVVALMVAGHRMYGTWQGAVDRYVALTDFSRALFIQGGLPEDKIVVKPNFLDRPVEPSPHTGRSFLYVGRLDVSKGIEDALNAWSDHDLACELRIAGTGPMEDEVKRAAAVNPRITYLGQLDSASVIEEMQSALAVIIPTRLYENFPMTLVEAFACGRPVIAPEHGALAEIVQDGQTGILFAPGDSSDLASKVHWAETHSGTVQEMGCSARTEYERKYTGAQNYHRLREIYGWSDSKMETF